MKYFVFIYTSIFFLIGTSCGDPSVQKKVAIVKNIEKISLSIGDIFDAAKVRLYMNQNIPITKESNDLFMKGVDAYKNKQQLDSAKYYFEHAIQQNPSPNTYYELGNVYKELKEYDQSLASYKLAEQLEYVPFSNLLYQMSGVYSLKDEIDLSSNYLEYALQAGFSDLKKIDSDKNLEALRENEYLFFKAMKSGMRGMTNPEILFWLQFKRQFNTAQYPLDLSGEIDFDVLEKFGFISYDFEQFLPEMRNAKFSREVGESYYFAYNIGENENYTALLYIEVNNFLGDYSPKKFRLTTYNSKGKIIDRKEISNFGLTEEELVTLHFSSPLAFTAKVFEIEYEKPLEDEGYWENKIINRKFLTSYNYTIDNKGFISYTPEDSAIASE